MTRLPVDASGDEGRAGCGRTGPEAILEHYLCEACAGTFMAVGSPLCTCCGKMFMSRQGPDHLCGHCSSHPWHFGVARSAGVFDRSLATLVYRLKYSGWTGLAQPLGALMLAVLLENWNPAEIDCVVPVPLHRRRLRARGFNQSFLLAQAWASRARKEPAAWPDIPVDPDLMERTRPTASQTGLDRKARLTNLKKAFRVSPGKTAAGLRLLLVDDVFTTGATVNECARILMQAGARRVDVLTLARTHIGYGKLHHGENFHTR